MVGFYFPVEKQFCISPILKQLMQPHPHLQIMPLFSCPFCISRLTQRIKGRETLLLWLYFSSLLSRIGTALKCVNDLFKKNYVQPTAAALYYLNVLEKIVREGIYVKAWVCPPEL